MEGEEEEEVTAAEEDANDYLNSLVSITEASRNTLEPEGEPSEDPGSRKRRSPLMRDG